MHFRVTKSSTISGANLLLMAIMMVKMMIIIMLMMMMILIAIKIMDIEYIWRISLNTMQIKVSSAMIYDFNQLVCICMMHKCSMLPASALSLSPPPRRFRPHPALQGGEGFFRPSPPHKFRLLPRPKHLINRISNFDTFSLVYYWYAYIFSD